MKLLLDENLSRRIVPFLQAAYPGSSQVVLEGLEQADDAEIWQYAKDHGFVIVTKDSDFQELSLLRGAPPKVIWLRTGNTTKANVIHLLTENRGEIEASVAGGKVICVEMNNLSTHDWFSLFVTEFYGSGKATWCATGNLPFLLDPRS